VSEREAGEPLVDSEMTHRLSESLRRGAKGWSLLSKLTDQERTVVLQTLPRVSTNREIAEVPRLEDREEPRVESHGQAGEEPTPRGGGRAGGVVG